MHTRPYHQGLSSSCSQRAWGLGSDELPFFVRSFAAKLIHLLVFKFSVEYT